MYGVIALFDEQTEQMIRNIWDELTERSISFYADEVVDRKPHITLASYNHFIKSDFIKQMDDFYNNAPELDISFSSIGSFLRSGALYFTPIVTRELLDFHSNHHKRFVLFNDDPESLYLPDRWIPHCTIANRLSPEKLAEGFHYCSRRNDAIYGKITEVAIIEFMDKSNVPVIYSKKLER
ncbi:2'-5' RNA ligase family protein [Paenibacillus sp. EC2-1]|uniref:2'-5' RNA ligase family protein n=1 Tax=Paenibacillus sp. EC2-1 TaxID=3388665 RepID=UPI003BEF23B6